MPRAKPAPERAWPADTVERRSVKSLLAYPRNPRTHSEQQVEQLAASMKEYGWTIPVLVDEQGIVIAGHGRLQAAAKLGIDEVPVMVARGWTDQQKASYRIWDNQSGLLSGWDEDMLRLELTDLKLEGYDLSLTGFDDVQLVQFVSGLPGADATRQQGMGTLSDRFGVPPFSVLNAREGWWQDRKRAWIALGIQSELGRGETTSTSARVGDDEAPTYRTIGGRKANSVPGGAMLPLDRVKRSKANATPGGATMPAADYSKRQRGDGKGRPIG